MNKAFIRTQEKELLGAIQSSISCDGCPENISGMFNLDPAMLSEEAVKDGWRMNLQTGTVRCPKCKGKRLR